MTDADRETDTFEGIVELVRELRGPDGCPWDREQTPDSLKRGLVEECYELIEAIESGDTGRITEELGDVALHVAFQVRMGEEAGEFTREAVFGTLRDKLVRRHPHVFGDASAKDAEAVVTNWERIKRGEKGGDVPRGALAGVPANLPALLQATRIGEKAARAGFDWPDLAGPRGKIDEELGELDEAVASGDAGAIERELGDVLFSLVNLARHTGVNPEMALRGTNERFRSRFGRVEAELGSRLADASLEEMEAIWQAAKDG